MVLSFVIFASFLFQLNGADDGEVAGPLARARATYLAAVQKARGQVLAAIDARIKEVAQSGNLENVKSLQMVRKAFESDGVLPARTQVRAQALTEYSTSITQAREAMDAAFSAAVREHTKRLEIDRADAVKTEWAEFKKNAVVSETKAGPTASVAGGSAPGFETKVYTWTHGTAPVKMIHKDKGFCYLSSIEGLNHPNAESAWVYLGDDGFWYLGGSTYQKAPYLRVQAVSVILK